MSGGETFAPTRGASSGLAAAGFVFAALVCATLALWTVSRAYLSAAPAVEDGGSSVSSQ